MFVALARPVTGLVMRVNERLRFASSSAARLASSMASAERWFASIWSNACCEMADTSTSGRLRVTMSR